MNQKRYIIDSFTTVYDKKLLTNVSVILTIVQSDIHRYIHSFVRLHCSDLQPAFFFVCLLRLLPTSHSSLLLQLLKPPVRSLGISPYSFLVSPLDLRPWVTAVSMTSLYSTNLPSIYASLSIFYSQGCDFSTPFFSPVPPGTNIMSRSKVRRQLRLFELSPQNTGMTVILKNAGRYRRRLHVFISFIRFILKVSSSI